jgi:hypothetical protein
MPTLDDLHRKLGEVSEAAQIIETDLWTMLLFFGVVDEGPLMPTLEADGKGATALLQSDQPSDVRQASKKYKTPHRCTRPTRTAVIKST